MSAEQHMATGDEARERPLVVFSLEGQRYALPLACVLRSILAAAMSQRPGAPATVRDRINLGTGSVPVIDMRRRFNHPARHVRLFDHLLITSTGGRTVALLVDDILGIVEAPPARRAPAATVPAHRPPVDGAVQLEGGLIFIHDLECLLAAEGEGPGH